MNNTPQKPISVRPQVPGFFLVYLLFGIPGFITSILWTLITFILLIGFIGGVAGVGEMPEDTLLYSTVTSNSSTDDAILIYDLTGIIQTGDSTLSDFSRTTGIYTEIVERDFKRIREDDSIKNVVFRVNTPGGSVFASQVLGDQIEELILDKGQEQAVFYFDQVAASGGLWAAYKNANYVVGSPYGQTGSIGVIISLPNFAGLAEKVGYSETVIKSSSSKDVGNPLRPVDQDEREFLQDQVDDIYDEFLDVVSGGRSLERSNVEEFANGFVYDNDEALEFGLLDELGQIDTAIQKAADNVGISDYDVLEIQSEPTFASLFVSSYLPGVDTINELSENLDVTKELEPGVVYAIDPLRI
jgi:protease-4